MGVNVSKMLLSVGAGGALLVYSWWNAEMKHYQSLPKPAILGLRNCGNSCFLNAVLQALSSCRFVIGWLRQKDAECNLNSSKRVVALKSLKGQAYPLISAMLRGSLILNRDIEGDGDDYINAIKVPGDVLTGLRANGYKIGVYQEQDAYELFVLLAQALNNEVEMSIRRNQAGSMNVPVDPEMLEDDEPLSWCLKEEVVGDGVRVTLEEGHDWAVVKCRESFKVNDRIYSKRQVEIPLNVKLDYRTCPTLPFRTLIFNQMQCIVCFNKSRIQIEACDAITLNFPPSAHHGFGLSLHDLLSNFMKPTLVHNVDCDSCTKKQFGDVSLAPGQRKIQSSYFKYNLIGKLPNTLCIHLPRYVWGAYGLQKRTEFVSFPERINLGTLRRFYDDEKIEEHDYNTKDLFTPELDSEVGLRRFKNSEYCLVAVISHLGKNVESGHFVTFRRVINKDRPKSSMWFYVSDETVRQVSPALVMASMAYMLFYEKSQVES